MQFSLVQVCCSKKEVISIDMEVENKNIITKLLLVNDGEPIVFKPEGFPNKTLEIS